MVTTPTQPPVAPSHEHPPRRFRTGDRSFQRTLASAKRTMVFSEIVKLAIESFNTSRVRFALTALGMVIGSASLILVFTIGLTGKEYILNEIQSIGTNMVELEYAGGGAGAINANRNDYLTREDERAIDEQVPSVALSSPMLEMHDRVTFPGGVAKDVLVLGVTPSYQQVRRLIVLSGRFFDEADETTHTKVAAVTEALAR
jgi:putative ABC transport system permease protein